MPYRYLILMFTGLLFLSKNAMLQENVSLYPVQFGLFYNALPLVNPASAGTNSDYNMSMGNQRLLGNFSKISTYYLNANIRILKQHGKGNSPFSSIGTLLYNDREGNYLNRSRFYLTYAWHGRLTRKLKFSGGFHAGGMNYAVKGTELSGGGSDIVPDAMVGIQVYTDRFYTGVSYNQVFKSQVQPIEEVAMLLPYVNLIAGTNLALSSTLHFRPDVLTILPSNGEKIKINGNIAFIYNSKLAVGLGLGLVDNTTMINTVELLNLLGDEQGLNILVSYGYPVKNTGLKTNILEIGISLELNKSNN